MPRALAIAGVAGVMFLTGCALQPLTRAEVDGRVVCDQQRMEQVEQIARRNGTQLRWVNCPTVTLRASL